MYADLEDRFAHKIAHSCTVCTCLNRRILAVVTHADDMGLDGLVVSVVRTHVFDLSSLQEVKDLERGLYTIHRWHLVVHHYQSIHRIATGKALLDEVYGLAATSREVTLELVLFEDAL